MEAVLDRRGFVVQRAATAEEAIRLLKASAVEIVIVETPLSGSTSQTDAAAQIRSSSPEVPILLVSDLALDRRPEDDFLRFGQLVSGHIDLLVRPLTQASFMSKAHSLIYTVTYLDSKKLFASATTRRRALAGA